MAAQKTIDGLRTIAERIARKQLAPWLQRQGYLDDCIQEVWMQLVKAQGRFDPSRGVTEDYYLWQRAKGAVIDYTDTLSFRRRHGGNDGPRGAHGATPVDCQNVYWAQGLPPAWTDGHKVFERAYNVSQRLEDEEFKQRFFRKFSAKRQRIARMVWGYYVEEKTLKQLGEAEGLSECWTCMLLKKFHQYDAGMLRTLFEESQP